MPYINGVRVSMQEWQDKYSSLKQLHTGPNGENPASDPVLNEVGLPVEVEEPAKPKAKRNSKQKQAAIADAFGADIASKLEQLDKEEEIS